MRAVASERPPQKPHTRLPKVLHLLGVAHGGGAQALEDEAGLAQEHLPNLAVGQPNAPQSLQRRGGAGQPRTSLADPQLHACMQMNQRRAQAPAAPSVVAVAVASETTCTHLEVGAHGGRVQRLVRQVGLLGQQLRGLPRAHAGALEQLEVGVLVRACITAAGMTAFQNCPLAAQATHPGALLCAGSQAPASAGY